jgi:choline dehydrogenase
VVKPTSRGTVTLRTASPYVKPRIRHNYLTTGEDRATILAETKVALRIAQQDALNDIITGPFAAPDPDSTDEELWTYIEQQSMTIYHPTSTCASVRSWTRASRSTASRACGLLTRRSCRQSSAATQTRQPS